MIHAVRTLALVIVLLSAGSAAAQETLTNDSVIAMTKAGLSESLVVAKIQATTSRSFDLSTTGLIALKQAGVSEGVIQTMMAPPGAPAAAAIATPAPGAPAIGGVKLRDRDVIYYVQDGKPLELTPLLGETKTEAMPFVVSSELVLKGRRAGVRILEPQPVFLSAYPATDAILVRLEPGSKKDDRNLKIGSGGGYWSFSTRMGVRDKDRVDTTVERTEQGLYRVTPREPLPAGEYGFVVFAGAGNAKVFDFGRD